MEQIGCYCCFKSLDPKDSIKGLRVCVQCVQCGATYHEVCWRRHGVCSRCKSAGRHAYVPPRIRPVRVIRRDQPKLPANLTRSASNIVREIVQPFLQNWISYYSQLFRALVLGCLFAMTAVTAGVYLPRIVFSQTITLPLILNAVSRESPSEQILLITGWLAAILLCTAFFLMPNTNRPPDSRAVPSLLTKVAGIAAAIVAVDVWFFALTAQDVLEFSVRFMRVLSVLMTQTVTAWCILVLVPFHRRLAPITEYPMSLLTVNVPSFLTSVYGWMRFLLVSVLLNLTVVLLSLQVLPGQGLEPMLAMISAGPVHVPVTWPSFGATVAGILGAVLGYWPPVIGSYTIVLLPVAWRLGLVACSYLD